MRAAWAEWRCDTSVMVRVGFGGVDRTWNLIVADDAAPAWQAFARVMAQHRYLFRESAGGTYNCRPINGVPGNPYSLHSYGLAIDLNPSKNPQGTHITDMPPGFISDVKALRCVNGRPCFQWGGDWAGGTADPMHWQVGATPSDIASGIVEPMALTPDEEEFVRWLKSQYESSTNPDFDPSVEKAKTRGVFSQYTQDEDVVSAAKLAVFLDRGGLLDSSTSGISQNQADQRYVKKGSIITLT